MNAASLKMPDSPLCSTRSPSSPSGRARRGRCPVVVVHARDVPRGFLAIDPRQHVDVRALHGHRVDGGLQVVELAVLEQPQVALAYGDVGDLADPGLGVGLADDDHLYGGGLRSVDRDRAVAAHDADLHQSRHETRTPLQEPFDSSDLPSGMAVAMGRDGSGAGHCENRCDRLAGGRSSAISLNWPPARRRTCRRAGVCRSGRKDAC